MSHVSLQISLEDALPDEIFKVVRSVFEKMFAVTPNAGKVRVYSQCAVKADVSGHVYFSEQVAQGALVLSFPEDTIYALLSGFYRKPFSEIDRSVESSVGELTNILYLMLKKNLNENGGSLKNAMPSVIVGPRAHDELCRFGTITLAIDFATSFGQFTVYANIGQEAAAA